MRKLLLLLSIFYAGQSIAQVGRILLTTKKTSTNEPSIYVDPNDPRYILVGTNVDNVFTSSNTGMGWTESKLQSSMGVYGDPVVYITKDGQYYYCHLSKTPGKSHPAMFDRIVFQKSKNRGATWNDGDSIGYNRGKMQDKPWIGVDESPKSPFYGRVYVSWTEFDKYKSKNPRDSSRIRFAFSKDSGDTFESAITISDTTGNCLDGDNTLEGATSAVGKDGEIYVVWAGHGNIYFDKSTNGGDTFGVDKIIAKQAGGWDQDISHVYRANSMPFVKTNSKGHIFVVYGDTSNGDHDIFLLVSKDKGETWSPPIRVNNDPIGNGKDQYMPNMVIDPLDDRVYIVYYDRAHSSSNVFLDVTVAATSYGKKFKYMRATQRSFPPAGKSKQAFFGDYIGIGASQGEIRPIWTDTEEGYITCKLALFNSFMMKKPTQYEDVPEYVTYFQKPGTKKLILHYNIPTSTTVKFELKFMGTKAMSNSVSGNFTAGEYEQEIDITNLRRGWHDLTVSFKGNSFKRKVMIL